MMQSLLQYRTYKYPVLRYRENTQVIFLCSFLISLSVPPLDSTQSSSSSSSSPTIPHFLLHNFYRSKLSMAEPVSLVVTKIKRRASDDDLWRAFQRFQAVHAEGNRRGVGFVQVSQGQLKSALASKVYVNGGLVKVRLRDNDPALRGQPTQTQVNEQSDIVEYRQPPDIVEDRQPPARSSCLYLRRFLSFIRKRITRRRR